MEKITLKHIGTTIVLLKLLLIVFLVLTVFPIFSLDMLVVDRQFLLYIGVGFGAQLIDGALGMAYGVSCSTFLLHLGIMPKIATAAVHTAEVFTTGVSGLAHLRFNNIDRPLFFRLVITGVIGAVLGAFLISSTLDGAVIKPYIACYLLLMGIYILYKGLNHRPSKANNPLKGVEILAFIGGMFDAIGGGGWGPIVTSNILTQGKSPRHTIGTVNTAEFFVAFFSTGVFIFFVGIESWKIVIGLVVGGILAAPFGAMIAAKIQPRLILIAVGLLIIATSLYTIFKAWV